MLQRTEVQRNVCCLYVRLLKAFLKSYTSQSSWFFAWFFAKIDKAKTLSRIHFCSYFEKKKQSKNSFARFFQIFCHLNALKMILNESMANPGFWILIVFQLYPSVLSINLIGFFKLQYLKKCLSNQVVVFAYD